MNKKRQVLLITCLFFVNIITSLPTMSSNSEVSTKGYDIIIPDSYSTIQEGIDNANVGYKIFVRSGIYKENILVDKERLIIHGENKYNTVLDGCKTKDDGITVIAENVTIQGFTVTNARFEDITAWDQAGVKIYSSNVIVNNCRFISNRIGIETYTPAYNLTISNNEFIDDGILLGNYFNSKEYPNLTKKDFIHNIFNNTVNGRPMYYYVDQSDFVIPSNAGQITLVNCTNVTIKDLFMSRNDFAIILAYCRNCLIENITVKDTDGEILFTYCENNIIQNSKISNTLKAVCLEVSSSNNIIKNNEFSSNYVGISIFTSSNNNTIYDNIAYNNIFAGIEIVTYHGGSQRDNIISNNCLFNNKLGILLRGNSIKNIIKNNSIKNNKIGIVLQKSSNYNIIEDNYFFRCPLPAIFTDCTTNYWNHNYWNRPRFLPKAISGLRTVEKIPAPWLNFDKNPMNRYQ